MSESKTTGRRLHDFERSRFLVSLVGLVALVGFLAIVSTKRHASLVLDVAPLINLLREREVGTDPILGGICVYLLFAVIWALLFEIIERVQPGSLGPLSSASSAASGARLVSRHTSTYDG